MRGSRLLLHLSDPSRVDGGLTHSAWRSAESPGRECEDLGGRSLEPAAPGLGSREQNSTWEILERMEGSLEAVSAEHVLTPSPAADPRPRRSPPPTPLAYAIAYAYAVA